MKAISKLSFALLSIWHCIVSFFSSYWLILSFYFMFDKTTDEVEVSLMVGVFMAIIWIIAYIPSFVALTKRIYRHKNNIIFALIPTFTSVILVIISLLFLYFIS